MPTMRSQRAGIRRQEAAEHHAARAAHHVDRQAHGDQGTGTLVQVPRGFRRESLHHAQHDGVEKKKRKAHPDRGNLQETERLSAAGAPLAWRCAPRQRQLVAVEDQHHQHHQGQQPAQASATRQEKAKASGTSRPGPAPSPGCR
jgi:hypothetical protein